MYETYYQLRTEPFRLSPDPRFCFQHRTYRKAMTYMRHALHRAEGFIMITGRPGTGKTTLIHDLLRTLKPDQAMVANLVTTQMTADDLLRLVAYAFNLNPEGAHKVDLLVRIERFLKQQYQQGRRSLLIVDEAQDMDEDALEELRLLTNIQAGGQQLLQIFLVGQEQLRDIVNAPSLEQLHQRMIAATHLETLNRNDTEAYIKHRLRRAGWTGDPLISKEAYAMIQQHSQGIPRQINQICSRLFLHGSIEEKHRLGISDVKIVVEELSQELLMPVDSAGMLAAVPRNSGQIQETYEEEPRRQTAPAATKKMPQPTRPATNTRQINEPARQRSTASAPAAQPSIPENKPAAITAPAASNNLNREQQAAMTARGAEAGTEPVTSTAREPLKLATNTSREPSSVPSPEQARVREPERLAANMAVSRENAAEKKSADDLTVRVPDQATPGKKKARKRSSWGLLVLTVLITGLTLSLIYQTNPELARLAGHDLMAWVGTVIKKDDSIPVGKSSPATTQPDEKLGQGPVVRKSPPVNDEPETDAEITETAAQEPDLNLIQPNLLQVEEELQQSGLLVEQMDDDVLKVNLSSDGMFAFDSAWIKDDARPALKSLTDVLRKRDELTIQVVGHTDSSGEAEYNLHLSRRRAKAVADYLIGQGLTDSSIQSEGRGDQNTRLEDSAGNNPGLKRRVEIYIRRDQEG